MTQVEDPCVGHVQRVFNGEDASRGEARTLGLGTCRKEEGDENESRGEKGEAAESGPLSSGRAFHDHIPSKA
jgi:hypothetical protein